MLPTTNARKATAAITGLRLGAIALKLPIKIPMELGFAKPQMANVAMPALRACFFLCQIPTRKPSQLTTTFRNVIKPRKATKFAIIPMTMGTALLAPFAAASKMEVSSLEITY
uniref:Uncharacterized protein n=1 Tax=Glossina brevipalpis TaxID=37001 RepID=A0A1A9WK10_9MUSC